MRGTAKDKRFEDGRVRITPAHAGNSYFDYGDLDIIDGSPPHMRGTGLCIAWNDAERRITPAHAGNSPHETKGYKTTRDHPRTCGEQLPNSPSCFKRLGSPPHMRGTDSQFFVMPLHPGITPAHAGNSSLWRIVPLSTQDHPRTCGEQYSSKDTSIDVPGSPPHMRGTVRQGAEAMDVTRITPAHAGNSPHETKGYETTRDHPRTCGEQPVQCCFMWAILGSPPHMRGTATLKSPTVSTRRITPAHAGNS